MKYGYHEFLSRIALQLGACCDKAISGGNPSAREFQAMLATLAAVYGGDEIGALKTLADAARAHHIEVDTGCMSLTQRRAWQMAMRRPDEMARPHGINVISCCSYCRRIEYHGQYLDAQEYLREHFGLEMSHGICPECFETEVVPQLQVTQAPVSGVPFDSAQGTVATTCLHPVPFDSVQGTAVRAAGA